MRMNRRNLRRTAGAMAITAGMLGFSGSVSGSSPGSFDGASMLALSLVGQQAESSFSVQFQGGTVEGYLDALREANEEMNIIMLDDVSRFALPPVELKYVTRRQAMEVLDGMEKVIDGRSHHIAVQMIEDKFGVPVFSVRVIEERMHGPQPETPETLVSQVWPVKELLTRLENPDQLVTAVETALEMMGEVDDAVAVRFHEETGLLIARGRLGHVRMIDSVINALEEQAASEMTPSEEEKIRQGYENHILDIETRAQQEIDAVRREVADAHARADRAEQLRQRDRAEVEEIRAQNAELRVVNEAVERDRDNLREHAQAQEEEINRLHEMVAELERQLNHLKQRLVQPRPSNP